jgi:1-aminocyclopropane-1-carboxylate deaminase/D-cysteine desulfhydrase-like pyridoxal-dependent ACC family enzyme
MTPVGANFPLFERFPGLAVLPRADLCTLPSPVHHIEHAAVHGDIWIKRDDLNAPACGGNKARSLEFLLGGIGPGDTVLTVGGAGSTHILSTIRHAKSLGAMVEARRWTHDMNPVAISVSAEIEALAPTSIIRKSTLLSLTIGRLEAWKTRARFIPIGGSSPLGILGHVNAALELDMQIKAGVLPIPEKVIIPLGSGGTTAGLLLGFAIAGLPIEVVGARVGPRAVVNRRRVMWLARRTASLIRRLTGERMPSINPKNLRIVHDVYGGAYGRPLPAADDASAILRDATRIRLDGTYSAKAWVAAMRESRSTEGPVLFWLTFDARCLTN